MRVSEGLLGLTDRILTILATLVFLEVRGARFSKTFCISFRQATRWTGKGTRLFSTAFRKTTDET
jgi:hypothetical protein